MTRLSVTAVLLLTLLAVVGVAHCHVSDGEVVGQPGSSDPEDAAAADGASYSYHNDGPGNEYVRVDSAAGTSIYFVNDRAAAGEDGEAAAVRPAHGRHRGHHPCRHGHRHHGLLGLRHGEEAANHGDGEAVLPIPVAEPDPDSRPADSAAVSLQEVQKTESHGEEEEAWRRFHHHRHHHHHDEHEDEHEHEKAAADDEASPMKRFRFHHHRREEEEQEKREEEEDSRTSRLRHHHHHHHDNEDDDSHELEEMARRLIRKALMKGRISHHGRRRFHHHLRFRGHRAAEEEEKGGVMKWIKDFVNQF